MFTGIVSGRSLNVIGIDYITSGSVGLPIKFIFDAEWTGLAKSAVFETNDVKITVQLVNDQCVIPHETLSKYNVPLHIGVYGTNGENVIIPTIWQEFTIHRGTEIGGEGSIDPTPSEVEQIEARLTSVENDIGDLDNLNTTTKSNLVAAVNELVNNAVTVDSAMSDSSENPVQNKVITKEIKGLLGENILHNGLPHQQFTDTWLYARGSTNVSCISVNGDSFQTTFPTGITASQAVLQLQKYLITNGSEGRGPELDRLKSGDKIAVSFELNSDVKLEYLHFRTACAVYTGGTTPDVTRYIDEAPSATGGKWVRFTGTGEIPDWWDSMKSDQYIKNLGLMIAFKADGTDFDGSVEKTVKIRNVKVEFGNIVTPFSLSTLDMADIAQAYFMPSDGITLGKGTADEVTVTAAQMKALLALLS